MERDPNKRQVKPAQNLFDFDDLGESSDDSDFRIEDHCEDSDDDSIDSDSGGEGKGDGNDDDSDDEDSDGSDEDESEADEGGGDVKFTVEDVLNKAKENKQLYMKDTDKLQILICCICLGDRSDAANEIVECDGCGVTVHEGCYGISENDSVSSTVSSCSTMPWFCEACRAGVENPTCELCPNSSGIFKETDVGKWVHLVCALYVPGVAFGEVDKLGSVTLFEMAYSKWGAKACQLCTDKRLARTGVAIGCDAGMCRTYFHVTCGQSNGLLAEAHCEEVDQADPFYAHCKLHSDKTLVRKRRRNWLALQLRMQQYKERSCKEQHINSDQQVRIQRKLDKYKVKYNLAKKTKTPPWVPTQKMGRLLTTSASACRALWHKAELSGVDVEAWEIREAQVAALVDVHRKWYIPPAFSVEFIGYYLDRNVRMSWMRRQLVQLLDENSKLIEEQRASQHEYNKVSDEHNKELDISKSLKEKIQLYHSVILKAVPDKRLPNLDTLGRQVLLPQQTVVPSQSVQQVRNHPLATPTGGVPTAAALKAGVGFPLGLRQSGIVNRASNRPDVPLNNECGICRRSNDQHLLAKCDTCHLYYHLGCLNPPLTRMPKKNKIMGWQCSECDKESSGSEVECLDPEAPRKLRNVKDNGDCKVVIKSDGEKSIELMEDVKPVVEEASSFQNNQGLVVEGMDSKEGIVLTGRPGKKRRREKHRRYSPEPLGSSQGASRPHKRKRKHRSMDNSNVSSSSGTANTSICENEPRQPLKICFKSIPHPTGEGSAYVATPSQGVTRTVTVTSAPVQITAPAQIIHQTPLRTLAARKKEEPAAVCSTCNTLGTASNLVRCDECLKGFHFHCLDPPVKKSPKVRGYSWHCAECDPTESDSS